MTTEQQLIFLCQHLNQEGKKPSLALLRNTKSFDASTPQMISALQSWQKSPTIEKQSDKHTSPKAKTTETVTRQELTEVNQKIIQLENRIIELETLLGECLRWQKSSPDRD